jgi:hypothetical protein
VCPRCVPDVTYVNAGGSILGESVHVRSPVLDDDPRWEVRATGDLITLRPSVWRTKGCKSHFVLSDGRVHWARDVTL